MKAVSFAFVTLLFAMSSEAQPLRYYRVDAEHLYLWSDDTSESTVEVERVNGKWDLVKSTLNTHDWATRLAAVAGQPRGDVASQRALDLMRSDEAAKDKATFRLPDVHALFLYRGSKLELYINSKDLSRDVPFKKGDLWSKGNVNVPIEEWLSVGSDEEGAAILARAMRSEKIAPLVTGQDWANYWNAVASRAFSSMGRPPGRWPYVYAATNKKQWLLVEVGGAAQTVFDRVRTRTPPGPGAIPLGKARGEPAKENGENNASDPKFLTHAGWFVGGLLLGALIVWLRLKGPPWRKPQEKTGREVTEQELETFIIALKPSIHSALKALAPAAAETPDGNAASPQEIDQKLAAVIQACQESAKISLTFEELAGNTKKPIRWLEALPERLKRTANTVSQIESSLATARTNLNAALQDARTAREEYDSLDTGKQAVDARIKEMTAQVGRAKELETQVAGLTTEKKDLENQLAEQRKASETLRAEGERTKVELTTLTTRRVSEQVAWEEKVEAARGEAHQLRQTFLALESVAERLQEGQKNHYSARKDGHAAAMVGFLTNHSLSQLALGVAANRAAQKRYMLLNLENIARSLSDLQGYQLAHQELERGFDRVLPPNESEVLRAESRAEAPLFQFILRYLRESMRVDLAPYYFLVDQKGSPYRAA